MKRLFFIMVVFLVCIGCDGNHSYKSSDSDNEKIGLHSPEIDDELLMSFLEKSSVKAYPVELEPLASSDYETEYKYNYKSGGYYNYDVSGYDEDGNYVYGNVDIDDDGDGYIEDEYGNEKHIDVEWVDWGVMESYDEDGVYYELNVE